MRRRSESATMQRMTHVIEHEDKENQQPNRQDANPLKRRQSMGIMKLDMTSTILSPASKRRRKSVSFGVVDMRVYEKHGAISGDNTMDLGTVARFLDNGHITPVQEHDDDEISIASEVKSIDENKPNAMVETKDTTEDVFWSPVKEKDVETKEQVVIKEQALVTETLVEKETPKKEAEAQVEQKKENDVQPLQFNSMLNSWDHPDSNTEITMPSPASSSSSSSISTPSKKQDTSSFMFSPVAPTSSHLTSLHSDLDMSMTRMITAPIHINRTLHDMGLFSPEQELSLSPSTSHDDDDDMMMTRSHSSVIQLRDESTSTPASTQATPKSILKKTPTSSKSSTPKPVHMVDMEMTKMLEHPIHTLSQTLDHDNTSSVNGQGNDNTSSVNAPNNDHTSNVALDDDDDDVITFKSDGDDTPDDDMEMTRAHGTITSHTPQEMNESMILTKVHDGLIQTTSTSTHDGLIQTISTHDDINTSNLTMELTGIIPTHVQTQVTSSQADVTSSQPDVTSQPDVASQSDVDTQQPDLSEKEMEMTHVHTRITRSTPQKSTPRVTRSTPTKHTTSASPALRRSSRISSTPTSTQTTPRRSSRLSVSSTISTPAQHQVQASPVSSRKRTPRTSTPSRRRSSMMEITESYGRILSYRDDISHDVSHGGAAHDVSRDGDIHENEITLDDANDSLMDVSQIRQRPPSHSSIDMEMTRDLGRILSHHTPRRSSRLSISTPTGPTSQLAMHMHRILKGDVMDRTCDLPSHDKLSENTALVAGMYAQILEGVDVDVDVIKKQVQQEKDELATEEEDVEEDVKPATSAVPASPAPLATPLATLDLLDESMDLTGSLPPITPVASASPAPSVTSITVSLAPVPTSRRSSVMSRRTSRASLAAIDEENVDIDEPISSEPESTTSTFQSFIHRVGLAEFDDDSMEHTQMKMRRRDSSYTGVSEEPSIWPPSTSHGLIEAATMIIPEIDELQQGCVEVIDEGADVKSKIKELENQIEISPPEIVKMVRDANPQQLTILQTHISQLLHRCKLDAKVSWCGWRGKLTSRTLTRLQSRLESLHGDIQKIQEMNMELASVKNVWNNVHDPKLIEMRKQIQDTCDRIMTSESTLSTWLQRESDVASHISSLQSQHTLLSQQLHDLHQNTLTTKQQQEQLQIQQDTYAILSSICGWKPTRSTSTSIRLVYMDMFELMIEKERDRIMKGIPVLQIIKKYENEQWISSLLSTARPIIDSNLSTCTSFQQLSTCLSHLSLHLGRIHDLIIECMRLSKTYHISYDDEHHAIITLTSEKTQSQVVLYIPLHASYPHTSLFPNKSSVFVIASHHDRLNVRTVRQMGMAQHGYGKLTRICHAIEKMLE